MYETLLGIVIVSLTMGLVIIAIGMIKAFKSKFYDLDSLMWLYIGLGFISFASILAKYL